MMGWVLRLGEGAATLPELSESTLLMFKEA